MSWTHRCKLPTGSPKSTWCQQTNLTHWAPTLGSEENKCMEIPGVHCVFVQLSPLGDPATQYRPPFLTGFLLLSAMFCCEPFRLTSQKQVTLPFGRTLPVTLWSENIEFFGLKKQTFHHFRPLLKLRIVSFTYQRTRNRNKKFCVIYTFKRVGWNLVIQNSGFTPRQYDLLNRMQFMIIFIPVQSAWQGEIIKPHIILLVSKLETFKQDKSGLLKFYAVTEPQISSKSPKISKITSFREATLTSFWRFCCCC